MKMGLFKRGSRFFPKDAAGRREVIMRVHREFAGNDDLANPATLDTLLDIIDREKDVFQVDSTVIYYIGYYKPFVSKNEETAKFLADGILADKGLRVFDNPHSVALFHEGCKGKFSIDSIVEWQKHNVEKIR